LLPAKETRTPNWSSTPDNEQFVSYQFQTLVIDIETGQITDSGSSNHCPDLASLGEIVTDHGAC
jgi:hypothetical protein